MQNKETVVKWVWHERTWIYLLPLTFSCMILGKMETLLQGPPQQQQEMPSPSIPLEVVVFRTTLSAAGWPGWASDL